jgi:branched-chain amino acid transport system substrate-binding protein
MVFAPRQWESLAATLQARMLDAGPWRRRIFDWGLRIGREVHVSTLDGKPVPARARSLLPLADALVLLIQTNTAAVVATKRALQAIGRKDVPVMMSSHNGLPASGRAIGGIQQLEGDYEVYGMAVSTDQDTEAKKFYDMLKAKYKLNAGWTAMTVMGLNQALVTVRTIESAIKDVGAAKVDGPAMRAAMLKNTITSKQTYGILPDIAYTNDAPFPLKGLTVNVGTIRNGQYVIAAQGVPVPVVNKW